MFTGLIAAAKRKATVLDDCADNLIVTLETVRRAAGDVQRVGFAAPTWLHVRLVLSIVVEIECIGKEFARTKAIWSLHVSDVLTQLAARFDEAPWSAEPAELLDNAAETYYQLGVKPEQENEVER